jgi:hypothetical protein
MRINNTQTNYFYGDAVFQGGLSALSGASFTNTVFTTTSALSVINTGIGPALYVAQAPGNYDIASFYDKDGIEVLHVGNAPTPGSTGKIGINESNPGAELTVNGAISSNMDTIVNELTVGKGNNSLSGNTAFGINALKNARSTSSTDSRAFAGMNVALGYNALSANTQGWQNVAIGYNALARNLDSREQVAIGAGALGKHTGPGYNVAVGQSAMNESTTSQNNTVLGYAAMYSNTTGGSNVAVGFGAMFNNSVGGGNTALGSNVLYNIWNGSSNVALGGSALNNTNKISPSQLTVGTRYTISFIGSTDFTLVGAVSNTIGLEFIATGQGTGNGTVYLGSSASAINFNNVAVGSGALQTNTIGINNTALGHQAGYGNNSANANLSGNSNIFIGFRALGTDKGDNNCIVIGSSAIGNGSNTATWGNTSITKHIFSTGNVGIGEVNPTAALTVNGAISSNDGITVAGGNSTQWNTAYTTITAITGISIFNFSVGTYTHTVPAEYRFVDISLIGGGGGGGGGASSTSTVLNKRGGGGGGGGAFTQVTYEVADFGTTTLYITAGTGGTGGAGALANAGAGADGTSGVVSCVAKTNNNAFSTGIAFASGGIGGVGGGVGAGGTGGPGSTLGSFAGGNGGLADSSTPSSVAPGGDSPRAAGGGGAGGSITASGGSGQDNGLGGRGSAAIYRIANTAVNSNAVVEPTYRRLLLAGGGGGGGLFSRTGSAGTNGGTGSTGGGGAGGGATWSAASPGNAGAGGSGGSGYVRLYYYN